VQEKPPPQKEKALVQCNVERKPSLTKTFIRTCRLASYLLEVARAKLRREPRVLAQAVPLTRVMARVQARLELAPEQVKRVLAPAVVVQVVRAVAKLSTRLSPSLIFDRETGGRPETTPFSSRVTGEALASILGEKEPLFGGDDDEQRAVWNRRSLKLLSRALGL
jgi:hypothetical protein